MASHFETDSEASKTGPKTNRNPDTCSESIFLPGSVLGAILTL